MAVAVTVWFQDGLSDIPGEIALMAGGVGVNIPVPGVGSGGLGGGVSYFYTPTPGDAKGAGFDSTLVRIEPMPAPRRPPLT